MKLQNLFELRRSGVEPKVNTASKLMEFASKIKPASKLSKYFVSFTNYNKLGIYPDSTFDTPNGIYAYPLSYVIKMIKKQVEDGAKLDQLEMHRVVPYAGGAPYVNLFTCHGRVIDLSNADECESMYAHLSSMAQNDFDGSRDGVDEKISLPAGYATSTPGHKFWSLTLYIANGRRAIPTSNATVARRWNSVFRKIGVDGVVDYKGKKIIHKNEPTQAYFTNIAALDVIERFYNHKRSGGIHERDDVIQGRDLGEPIMFFLTPLSKRAFAQNGVSEMLDKLKELFMNFNGEEAKFDDAIGDSIKSAVSKICEFFGEIINEGDVDKITEKVRDVIIRSIGDLNYKSIFDSSNVYAKSAKNRMQLFYSTRRYIFSAVNMVVRRRISEYVIQHDSMDYLIKTFARKDMDNFQILSFAKIHRIITPPNRIRELRKLSDFFGADRYREATKGMPELSVE